MLNKYSILRVLTKAGQERGETCCLTRVSSLDTLVRQYDAFCENYTTVPSVPVLDNRHFISVMRILEEIVETCC